MQTLLQLEHLEKRLADLVLFEDVSVSIHEGQKIGLIGRNGAGKSTLLRIIIGQEAADRGRVVKQDVLRLGYLEQHASFNPGETVIDFLERVSQQPRWTCAKLAGQFDLKHELLEREVLSLSGGYQMRVRLTATLLLEPNLLLLDEPTNYLDVQTQLLLEAFLREWQGAFVIVSHDREFLKQTCTHTFELDRGELTTYPGPIEEYLAYRAERLQTMERSNKSIDQQRKHLESFINRFRAKASKATQAQSKMKQLAKLELVEIKAPAPTVRMRLPQVEYRKSFAVRATHLSIGYEDRTIASDIDFELMRGEHVAIVGENGQGKSTLLKTFAGQLRPIDGTFTFGNRLRVAYFDQHVRAHLHPDDTIESYLSRAASGLEREEILRMAGDFLFRDDDLKKRIGILSGGEAARLVLAGLFLGRFDVLLLDEPTNHLDFETAEALAEALKAFQGTVLFVSHARTFANALATTVLEVRDGTIKRYPGNYESYIYAFREALHVLPQEISDEPTERPRTKAAIHQDIRDQQRQQKKLEKEMEQYEKEKADIMAAYLAHPTEFSKERNQRLVTLNHLLEFSEAEWIKAQGQVEHFEHELRRLTKHEEMTG